MPRIKTSTWVWVALFAAWLLAGLAVPNAHATILFAGGEDIDFVANGAVTYTTAGAGTNYRSAYARLGIQPNATSGSPPVNRINTPTFTNTSSLWFSMQVLANAGTTSANEGVTAYGSDGVRRLMIRGTGSVGTVKISKRNAAGTFTDLVTCSASFPTNTLEKLDWFINYAVAGEVTLYRNGVQFCDFVGDVTTDGVTSLSAFDISSFNSVFAGSFSEIIVSTTDTRSFNLFLCAPQANGVNQTWTGNQTNVNGTTANDATPLTTGSNNQTAEFTCPALPAGSFSVAAVKQSGRVLKGASGPQNFRFIARPSSGSTDFDSGSDIGLTTNFGNFPFYWATNPACSCSWTTNDITTGVNFGVLSKP